MAVRTTRAAGPVVLGSSSTLVYTVPSGRTFRGQAMMLNRDTAAGGQFMALAINGTGFINQYWGSSIPPKSAANVALVLNPGDTLYAWIEGPGAGGCTLHGSLLLGAPA